MLKILLTGAAGFIGSNALEYFKKKDGYYVTAVIDKLTYAADINNLRRLIADDTTFYKHDIYAANWAHILHREDPDVVINFAAESHVDNALLSYAADDFVRSNCHAVVRLVNALRKHNQENRNVYFIQISTDEVLGDLPFDSKEEFDENQPLNPNNLYSATKASAEFLVESLYRSHGDFNYTVVRATNNYGPYQHSEKFIPTIVRNAADNSPVPLYGSGKNVREWLWTGDFIYGLDLLVQKYFQDKNCVIDHIFHFGSGERVSNLDMAELVLSLMEKPKSLVKMVQDRPGHDRRYALCNQKAQNVLQWEPRMELETGLRTAILDVLNRKRVQ